MLKNRMLATQQASELEVGNAAYETLFQTPSNAPQPKVCKLDRKSTRLNSSHVSESRMPSSA